MTSKVSVIGYVTRAKFRATFDHSYGLIDHGLPQKKKMQRNSEKKMQRNVSMYSTSSKPSNSRMSNTSSKVSTKNKRKQANKGNWST